MGPQSWANSFGPAKVLYLYGFHGDLEAVVVLNNVALSPTKGGNRLVSGLNSSQFIRLPRALTLKSTAAARFPLTHRYIRIWSSARPIRELTHDILPARYGANESCTAVGTGPAAGGWET